jgi:hypothetical protein
VGRLWRLSGYEELEVVTQTGRKKMY